MNLGEKINRIFGFTKTESRIVLFLVGTFLIGGGIRLFTGARQVQTTYDYTSLDSEFASRVARIDSFTSFSALGSLDSTRKLQSTAASSRARSAGSDTLSGPIDLNRAGREELMKLPGVGPSIADRIIDYRTTNGSIRSVDDLRRVKGIGRKKFDKIRPFVKVVK